MTRRPLTDAQLRNYHTEHETSRWFNGIAPKTNDERSDGSSVQPSNFFDPPSGVKKKAKPKSKSWSKAFDRSVERGRAIMGSGDAPQSAADLVGLYAVLHEHVFGVLPLELKQDYGAAAASAAKLVRDEFKDDYAAAERFVAWCWKRTKQSAKRKKADGDDPFRPGWRIQFKSRAWLTDYKAAGKR